MQIDPLIEGKYLKTLKYAADINSAEKEYGIPSGLLAGLVMHESGGNPRAVSRVGAGGLTQLMPATAKELGAKVWWYGSEDKLPVKSVAYGDSLSALVKMYKKNSKELAKMDERFNPRKNIYEGAEYFRRLYNQLGDWDLALKAYNVGPNHKKFHRINSGYPKTARRYQEYWNGRNNRRLPEFAYSSSNTPGKL